MNPVVQRPVNILRRIYLTLHSIHESVENNSLLVRRKVIELRGDPPLGNARLTAITRESKSYRMYFHLQADIHKLPEAFEVNGTHQGTSVMG